jgi:hypothetical protein
MNSLNPHAFHLRNCSLSRVVGRCGDRASMRRRLAFAHSRFPSWPGKATKLCFAPMSRPSTSLLHQYIRRSFQSGFASRRPKDVDARDKPGHDEWSGARVMRCDLSGFRRAPAALGLRWLIPVFRHGRASSRPSTFLLHRCMRQLVPLPDHEGRGCPGHRREAKLRRLARA